MKRVTPLHAVSINWGAPPVPDGTLVLPPPSPPIAVARRLVEVLYMLPMGPSLRSYRGDFYERDGTHYVEVAARDVRGRAYELVEHAVYMHPEKGPQPFAPTQRKVADLLEALRAIVLVESRPDAPLWIGCRADLDAAHLIAMQNALLDVRKRILHPHTPKFFNLHALPFAFDPKSVTAPRWRWFLDILWPDDDHAIASLQEMIGYLLTADTRQQKVFMNRRAEMQRQRHDRSRGDWAAGTAQRRRADARVAEHELRTVAGDRQAAGDHLRRASVRPRIPKSSSNGCSPLVAKTA